MRGNMKVKFPQTLDACLTADESVQKSLWRIGTALVREAEDNKHGERGIKAVSEELEAHNLKYKTSRLFEIRRTAVAFPASRRLDLPFQVHSEAGNPDTLDVIVKAARKDNKKVTIWYVRNVLQHQREEARKLLKKHKDSGAAKSARPNTSKSNYTPPDEDQVSVLEAIAAAKTNANKARKLAEETKKSLRHNVEDLSPAIVAGLTDAAMKAANAWTEVANQIRSHSLNKRGHLAVVEKSAVNE